jgi:uncharacterized protein YjcR
MSNNPKHKNVQIKCLARTRAKGLCRMPPVTDKRRCRMHGGAKGSGAPINNKNALKHGYYSKEQIDGRREVATLIRQFKDLMREVHC